MGNLEEWLPYAFPYWTYLASGVRRGRSFMTTVNGLPAHILFVHAIVVLLPLTALLLVLTAVSAAARRRLAGPNAILSVAVVAIVPLTTSAGEWLQYRVPDSALLRDHTELVTRPSSTPSRSPCSRWSSGGATGRPPPRRQAATMHRWPGARPPSSAAAPTWHRSR